MIIDDCRQDYWFQCNCWTWYFFFIHPVSLNASICTWFSFFLPSCFSVRKMSNSIARLRYWFVSLLVSIGMKHVISCSFLTSENAAYNHLLPKHLIPFDKLYVWANIWPNTMVSYVVYLIFYSFYCNFCLIKLLVWCVVSIVLGSNL